MMLVLLVTVYLAFGWLFIQSLLFESEQAEPWHTGPWSAREWVRAVLIMIFWLPLCAAAIICCLWFMFIARCETWRGED